MGRFKILNQSGELANLETLAASLNPQEQARMRSVWTPHAKEQSASPQVVYRDRDHRPVNLASVTADFEKLSLEDSKTFVSAVLRGAEIGRIAAGGAYDTPEKKLDRDLQWERDAEDAKRRWEEIQEEKRQSEDQE